VSIVGWWLQGVDLALPPVAMRFVCRQCINPTSRHAPSFHSIPPHPICRWIVTAHIMYTSAPQWDPDYMGSGEWAKSGCHRPGKLLAGGRVHNCGTCLQACCACLIPS